MVLIPSICLTATAGLLARAALRARLTVFAARWLTFFTALTTEAAGLRVRRAAAFLATGFALAAAAGAAATAVFSAAATGAAAASIAASFFSSTLVTSAT